MTASEKGMWEALRALKMDIRRQVPIGRYVADFAHHASKLIVEVDGSRHNLPEAQLHDAERDAWFASIGYRTLRIDDREAYGNPCVVAEQIRLEILKTLPPQGGKGRVGGASPTLTAIEGEKPASSDFLAGGSNVASPESIPRNVGGAPSSPTLPPLRGKGEY
jgi:very-short-patch-repair endonuclease